MNGEIRQSREQILYYIILGLVLTGIVAGLAFVWIDGFSSPWLLRALAVIIVALIAYALQKAGQFMTAAYVLVLELVGVVAGMFLQPDADSGIIPYFFIPLILIAGLLLNSTPILVITTFSIGLTIAVIALTGQLNLATVFNLILPFGAMILTALVAVGVKRYWGEVSNLLPKTGNLARKRSLKTSETQQTIDALQQRVTNLQQQVLQAQAEAKRTYQPTARQDHKFQNLIQGAVHELDVSIKQLEASVESATQTPGPNGQLNSVEDIWQTIDHLTSFVVNLEEMVELESSEVTLYYQTIDVGRLLNDIAATAQGLVGGKKIEVRCQIPDTLPPLQADPDRIRQALLYLVNNAVKYTHEGHIDIQAELNQQEITLFVSDTGVGIPPEEQGIIFEKFGRRKGEAAKGQSGAGLGLSISKYLVELHRGRMWSTSVRGIGSTFFLALPLEPVRSAATEREPVDQTATLLSLPAQETVPSLQPDRSNSPVDDPEKTVLSLPAQKERPQAASPSNTPSSPTFKPTLSPVARYSPTYVSRFGFSLLGLLIIISIVVAILAAINEPLESTSAAVPVTEEATSVIADLIADSSSTATPVTGQVIILTPTALPTNTPSPTLVLVPSTTPSPLIDPTETPIPVIVAPTSTPTAAPTSTAIPTATPPPTSSPTPPPPATAFEFNRATAVAAVVTVEPTVAPRSRLFFVAEDNAVERRNPENELEHTDLDLPLDTVENSRLAWSPNGRQLLFTSERDGQREIYVADVAGSQTINLTQSPADDQQPSWSPTGEKMAFSSGRNGNFDIYVINADGGDLVQLTTSRGFDEWPVWSPDGRQIAFTSDRDGGVLDLYVMNADGGDQRRLTNDAADEGPATWSPDGGRLVFASNRDGNSNLYLINLSGGPPIRLTNDPANEQTPVWSPDGRAIAFIYDGGDSADVYTIPAPQGSVTEISRQTWTQVTDTPTDERYPIWQP